MIVIRESRPEDSDAISEVREPAVEILRRTYRPTDSLEEAVQSEQPWPRIVALISKSIVGTVEYNVSPERIHIRGLSVFPAYQRKGVARALIVQLNEYAKSRKIPILSLYTVVQTGNVPIFERLGFRVIRERPASDLVGLSGREITEAYMERPSS